MEVIAWLLFFGMHARAALARRVGGARARHSESQALHAVHGYRGIDSTRRVAVPFPE
jgi:hypothetical protein